MKKQNSFRIAGMSVYFLLSVFQLCAQDDNKPELIVSLNHFTINNSAQYVKVQTKLKADNKLQPLKEAVFFTLRQGCFKSGFHAGFGIHHRFCLREMTVVGLGNLALQMMMLKRQNHPGTQFADKEETQPKGTGISD